MVVVWSANHFYYNGELFSCLLYSSLKAIICPPAKPGVAFGTTNKKVDTHTFVSVYFHFTGALKESGWSLFVLVNQFKIKIEPITQQFLFHRFECVQHLINLTFQS